MTFLDYANRGKNDPWRYAAGLGLGLLFALIIGAILLIPATLFHLLPSDIDEQMKQIKDPFIFFPMTAATFGLFLAGYALAAIVMNNKSPLDLLGGWTWKAFALGAGVWLAYLGICTLIDYALAPKGFRISTTPPSLQLTLVVLGALAVQTFTEEYVFRGYLTQGLLVGLKNPYLASLVCGLAFGALHIPNGPPQAASAVVFGIVLSLIAIRTGSLAFGSGLHLVNNSYGAILVVSEQDVFRGSPGLLYQNTPHLAWWDLGLGLGGVALVAFIVWRFVPAPISAVDETF